jgi:hypothetical protein
MLKQLACRVADTVDPFGADRLVKQFGDADDYPLLSVLKAATSPASTTVSGWAAELIQVTNAQWISSLAPSAFAQLADATLGLSYAEDAIVRIPGRSASPEANGAFIGQGDAIPVRRINMTASLMTPRKLGVISTFTAEIGRGSQPNLEAVLREEIVADTTLTIDAILLDDQPATTVRPAGLRNGVTPLTAAAAGLQAMATDIKALIGAIGPAANIGLLANPVQAAALAALYPADTFTVITSASVPLGTVIAVDLAAFIHVSGLPEFDLSTEAVVHEESETPLPLSATGTPNVISAPERSFFQTDVIGIRMIWRLMWQLRRTGAVAVVESVNW